MLVYDTLQYIAVSKRDFHQNHYLLTKELLELWQRARRGQAPDAGGLPRAAPRRRRPRRGRSVRSLILSGFVLDGQLSRRELRRLDTLQRLGILPDRPAEVRRQLRRFLAGGGLPLERLPRGPPQYR